MDGTQNTIVEFFQVLPSLARFGPQVNLVWLKSRFEIRGSTGPIRGFFFF